MKAIGASPTRGLQPGSFIRCVDNSGADLLQMMALKGYHGVKRRRGAAGIGDVIVAAVKRGDPKMRHEVVEAVIVRVRKAYRRRSGMRVKFEDNAAVLINERGEPRGTRLKGPIAREVVERWSAVGKIATAVV